MMLTFPFKLGFLDLEILLSVMFSGIFFESLSCFRLLVVIDRAFVQAAAEKNML